MTRALLILCFAAVVACSFASPTPKKIFERCELVRWLRNKGSTMERTWTCIAYHESSYNSAAQGPPNSNGSRDHGLWQVNDRYWCTTSGVGNDCNINCADLRDDDITDDWECVTYIQQKQGFTAWSTWKYCDAAENDASWDAGC